MFFSFKVADRNLSTFNKIEQNQINKFQTYIMSKPDGFCSVCMKVLYPEDQKYRLIRDPEHLPCIDWKLKPKTKMFGTNKLYMVCSTHFNLNCKEEDFLRYAYPGLLSAHFI